MQEAGTSSQSAAVQMREHEEQKSVWWLVFCVQGLSFCDPVDPPVNLELISQVNLFPAGKQPSEQI